MPMSSKFPAGSTGEKILKIDQYLAKIWTKYDSLLLLGHPVYASHTEPGDERSNFIANVTSCTVGYRVVQKNSKKPSFCRNIIRY